ncbi:MAG: YitT family protein [Bacilli bacterium]|nr:YitT family protein [Bacilli bacterium]
MGKGEVVVSELIEQLNTKNRLERCAIFIWGVLIYAIAFSIFFSPRNIVTGGSTGLSLLLRDGLGIDPSISVFVVSFGLLIVGYFLLGKYETFKALFGVILLPIFMEFSSVFQTFFDVTDSSLFLVVFFGGIMMGLGNGMIVRSGYSVGGFLTIYQILYKYFGISIGKSTLWINGTLIFISGFFFGFSNSLYAVIGLYVSSVVTDKVMLETSITKTFYIVTEKEKDISQYIVENLGYGVTVVNAKGGYSNDNKKVLMCAVPTRQYYQLKEVIQSIDKDVFFLITDTYEIYGGV